MVISSEGSNTTMVPNDPYYLVKPYQQMVAACSGALLTSLLMTPLDVVKIRLQTQQKAMLSNKCYLYCNGLMDHLCPCPEIMGSQKKVFFNGTFDAILKISRHEGITSLWSGLSPTLILAVPNTMVYFVLYEQLRLKFKAFHTAKTGKENQPVWIPLISGAAARTGAVLIFNPLELIRTKMQSQKMTFSETQKAIAELVNTKGILGLWRGLGSTIMRDVPFSGIYWMNYETIKSNFGNPDQRKNTYSFNFIAGAISGTIAALLTLPFDVVKTHQQIELGEKEIYSSNGSKNKTKGMFDMIRNIYRNNGISGLFTGLTPRIIKVAPACAIMISSFEFGKSFFQEYNRRKLLNKEESFRHYVLSYNG